MALNIDMFTPFKTEDVNSGLVALNKYGVLVATDGEWVPTEISESDFSDYELFSIDYNVEEIDNYNSEHITLIQEISKIKKSNEYSSWVYVSKISS